MSFVFHRRCSARAPLSFSTSCKAMEEGKGKGGSLSRCHCNASRHDLSSHRLGALGDNHSLGNPEIRASFDNLQQRRLHKPGKGEPRGTPLLLHSRREDPAGKTSHRLRSDAMKGLMALSSRWKGHQYWHVLGQQMSCKKQLAAIGSWLPPGSLQRRTSCQLPVSVANSAQGGIAEKNVALTR